MNNEEIYFVIANKVKERLENTVYGIITVALDKFNLKISIDTKRYGVWRYTIYDIDKIDYNRIGSEQMANWILCWHRNRILRKFFIM